MSLRIVALIGLFRPAVGGTEVQTALLAREWATLGHHVEIWTRRLAPHHAAKEAEGDAVVRRLGWASRVRYVPIPVVEKLSFHLALWLRLFTQRNQYDVVIAQQALYPAVAAAFASWLTKRPLVVRNASTGATSDLGNFRTFSSPLLRLLRNETRALVVLNQQGAREAEGEGFSPAVVHAIPNGLQAGPAPGPRPVGRRPRVVYVGVFRPEKQVDLLLRAWARAGSPGDLLLAGEGPLRASLELLARELGINPEFLGNVDDPRGLLRDADVFVLSSRAEGMSNALLEAMAEGCACLATFVGGNVDCLAPRSKMPPPGGMVKGPAGWLVNPGDETAMADALVALCGDRELRESLGRVAREKVLADHALEKTAKQYLEIFQRLVD